MVDLVRDKAKSRVVKYLLILLVLYALGVLENRVDSEGMGYLPLIAMTTPWSWLTMPVWDWSIWGSTHAGQLFAIFLTCNVVSGSLNSFLIFRFTRWREKKSSKNA